MNTDHRADELVFIVERELEVEIEGKVQRPETGEGIFIPAHAVYTGRNIGRTNNIWYYRYKI